MINKQKKIGALAAAFVALSLISPASANAAPAASFITVGITNPATGVSDYETVLSSTTVADLRNEFVGVLGNGVAKHLLTLNGKKLADAATLSGAGVADGDVLGVGAAIGGLNVEAYHINQVNSQPTDANITSQCTSPATPKTVGTVNFSWGGGSVLGCDSDFVLVKFKGYVGFPTDRTVQFCTGGDDGNRLLIDDQIVTNSWYIQAWGSDCGQVVFKANESKKFEYDYYEWGGGAIAVLNYQYTEDGSNWTNSRTVPSSAFINGSNWADETSNVITGIDSNTHKLTAAGKTAVAAWYNAGGSNLSSVRLVGNTDNNSASLARVELNSVRNELKKLGYTGTFGLVAHDGDRGNSDNGNVDEVRLPAVTGAAAGSFWSASGFDPAVNFKRAQFSYQTGSVSHTFDVQSDITGATVRTLVNNAIDNSIMQGSIADDYSLTVSLRDENDVELAANSFSSNTIHGNQTKAVTVNYTGHVDHIVFTATGIDNGFWAGHYGPTVHGAKLTLAGVN